MISFKPAVILTACLVLFQAPSFSDAETKSTESVELSYEDLSGLDTALHGLVETRQTANLTYGLWQRGILIREGYFGPVSPINSTTVSEDTIFSIQSMTKAVTAIGMLILAERGAFDLDDPITDILPEFEDVEVVADIGADGTLYTFLPPNPPTIRELLSHTAGIGNARNSRSPIETRLHHSGVLAARHIDDVIGIAASVPYIAAPGAEWNYSISSDLQGAIIERVSGERLGSFLERELFEPLGMTDTRFFVLRKDVERVSGIMDRAGSTPTFRPNENTHNSAQSQVYHEGGHGLFSTPRDYLQFLTFLLRQGEHNGDSILRSDTIAQLSQNAIRYRGRASAMDSVGRRRGLGFGFGVGTIKDRDVSAMAAPVGSYYWYGALGTWFWVDPVNEIIFIAMAQTNAPMETDYIRDSMRLVYGDPAASGSQFANAD